jgi:hypothetical protein
VNAADVISNDASRLGSVSPEKFAMRENDYNDAHLGAWRAYYKALVEANVYVGADALEVAETATTASAPETG